MADRVIQRNDTAARWQSINPILAQGEMGIVSDGAKGYKIGDGVTRWNDLPYPANPANIVQELGDSETAVISQKIVTEEFENLQVGISSIGTEIAQLVEKVEVVKEAAESSVDRLDYMEGIEILSSKETPFLKAWVDKDGRLIAYIDGDGKFHASHFENEDINNLKEYNEFVRSIETLSLEEHRMLKAWTDKDGKLVAYIDDKGVFNTPYFATLGEKKTSSNGDYIAVWTDKDGKILAQIDKEGVFHISHLEAGEVEEKTDNLSLALINRNLTVPHSEASLKRLENIVFQKEATFVKPSSLSIEREAMFTLGDDDTIDHQLNPPVGRPTGGFLSLLYPVCASVGVIATIALEGHRCGFLEGELNRIGKVALDLQKKIGWEVAGHTMTARFGQCFVVQSIAEANAFPDHPVSGGNYTSNSTRQIFVEPEQKNYYWATDNTWKETPREYIKPFLTDFTTKTNVADNPTFPMEYQYSEYQQIAKKLGFNDITQFVVVAATMSHKKRREIRKTYRAMYSSWGFSSDNTYYIKPPLASCIRRTGAFELGETDTDNTATDALFDNNWKLVVDRAISERAYVNINVHMYRPCWVNKIDSELVSNGGTYPDEWVFPVDNPDTNPNYLAAPKASTGLTSWDQWHPCPGTRLYQLWRCLKYIKENAKMVSHEEFHDRYQNILEVGDWTNGRANTVIHAPFDDVEYNHYIIGVNGQESYRYYK